MLLGIKILLFSVCSFQVYKNTIFYINPLSYNLAEFACSLSSFLVDALGYMSHHVICILEKSSSWHTHTYIMRTQTHRSQCLAIIAFNQAKISMQTNAQKQGLTIATVVLGDDCYTELFIAGVNVTGTHWKWSNILMCFVFRKGSGFPIIDSQVSSAQASFCRLNADKPFFLLIK